MKLGLSSFRRRLAIGAIVWISVGFLFSWVVLSHLLRTHMLLEFASELDHHATELAEIAVLDPAGGVATRAPLSDFRFSVPRSGYYWQLTQPQGATVVSRSLGDARLPLALDPAGTARLREGRAQGPTGEAMLMERLVDIGGDPGFPVHVAIAMDMSLISASIGSLERAVAIAMACLATGLILAAYAQIAFGLRPLARIEQALLAIKRGDARRMPADLPTEVRPLVDTLNTLLNKNEEMIKRARLQAGNLAHALKSSLALLQLEAETLTANGQSGGAIQQQCDAIRRQIDYQLARARATASRMGGAHATRIGPAIENVVAALRRLHRHRPVTFSVDHGPTEASVAVGPEDLEEVLGNLIDNAAKWANSRVEISTLPAPDGKLRIRVEDDGPGMPADMHERVFQPGQRLDEATPGTGLGLAIARDVVELYDGRMWIERSRMGGACVVVEV